MREERPDGSDFHSFPSETTAVAASGSSFLWGRYGWEYGLPAEAATAFVSFSRVEARQHRWYDTLASSAIAAGYGMVLTTPFKRKYNLDTSLSATPDGGFVRMSYKWWSRRFSHVSVVLAAGTCTRTLSSPPALIPFSQDPIPDLCPKSRSRMARSKPSGGRGGPCCGS